jgi:uncharacterized protein YcfJ
MKKSLVLSMLGLAAAGAAAQEVGTVVSSVPVIQQVAVPRQVCSQQPVAVAPQTSGGGALIGALIGGVVGNQFGHGSGRAAATAVGMMGGAMVGNAAEAGNRPAYADAPVCSTQTSYENRTVGYNVTYEYAGKQYAVQMPYDPGPTIRLQVTPEAPGRAPGSPIGQPYGPSYGPPPVTAPPMAAVPQVAAPVDEYGTVYSVPAPAYYHRPAYAYPPVGVSLGFVFSGHRHHHRHHRHHRH